MKQTYKSGLKAVLLCLATVSLLTACGKDADGFLPDVSVKELTVTTHVNGYVPEGAEAGSRASSSGNAFNFTSGDAIGLIALKNGSVVSEYNNVKLTYSGGGWRSSEPLYDFGATSYIAYYPYRSDMAGKTSVDAIKSAFPIETDQSTEANFNASNLLTASATLSGESLRFNFTPAFAMVEVTVPDEVKGYSNANGEKYTYKIHGGSWGPTFSLKFYKISDKTYRRIIKPSTSTQIKVSYNVESGYTVASYTKSVNIGAGNYKKLVLKGTINRNIEVGDCVYNGDGDIVFIPNSLPPNWIGHGSDILGVVASVGNVFGRTDAYTHGLVMASKEAANGVTWNNAPGKVSAYSPAAPSGTTTGWYLPDRNEMQYLCSGSKGNTGTSLGEKLNSYIGTWGQDFRVGQSGAGIKYWTSEEISSEKAYWVLSYSGTVAYDIKRYQGSSVYVRAVFSF